MKKITMCLFIFFMSWQIDAQTGTVVIGVDDGTPNGNQGYPAPLQDYYKTNRSQYLFLSSELSAAGLVAGPITEIGWVVTDIGESDLQEGYKISMKSTSTTSLTTTFETGATLVYGPTDFTPSTTGNVTFELDTPFNWDGTSNIIIEVCAGSADGEYTENVISLNSTLSFNGSAYFYSDEELDPCNVTTIPIFYGGASVSRPLLVITGNLADCLAPTGLISANVTAYTAEVSWEASVSGIAEGYEYVLSTSNTTPTGSGTPTVDLFTSFDDLDPQTTYYLFVRANCGSGDFSNWSISHSFTTGCIAVTTFPFVETFNTDSTSKACWTVIDGNSDGDAWNLSGDYMPRSGRSAQLYTDYNTGNNDYLITPQLDLGSTPKRLKFWVKHRSDGEPDNLNVKVSTTGKSIGDFTGLLLALSTTQLTMTYTEYVIDLTDYVDTPIYIAFAREDEPADGWYLLIDDVTVEDIPGCPDQTGLIVSNITATEADASWDDMSGFGAAGYEYAITTSATPPASGTATTNTFYEASGLVSNTLHYLHVRTTCDGENFGLWTSKSFRTLCAPITVLPYLESFDTVLPDECWARGDNGDLIAGPATFGSNSWYESGFGNEGSSGAIVYNLYTTGANDWIISPKFTIPATGYELKFLAAATDYSTTDPVSLWEDDDFVEVLVSTEETTNWTVLDTYNSSNIPSNTGTSNVLNLDDYAGQTVRFAFRAVEGATNGTADFEFFVDNFEIRLTPTCPDQTGLVVGNITSDGASISWDDMSSAGAIGYEYAITTSPTPPTSGTSIEDNFYDASGLAPQTVHYLHVRVSCEGGNFGYWATTSFTTLCAPVTALPYIENFNTFLPLCWILGEDGDLATGPSSLGYSDWVNDGFDNVSSAGAIRYNLYTTGANDWVITPQFVIPATGYELKFDAAAFQWASTSAPSPAWEADDFIQVLVSTNETSDWNVLYTYDNTNVPSTSGTANVINLDDYAGETVRFALRAVEGTDNGTTDLEFIVDNFEIRVALNSNQFDKSALKVYPNPTKNILKISYSQEISNVEIFNLVGQKIMMISPNANEGQIDMSNLASGAYFVKVTSNNVSNTVKVIKE
jgi:hypothetical protein